MARDSEEIVERRDAFDGGRERGGDLWIAHVGDVFPAIRQEQVVNFGVKGLADLRGSSGEIDYQSVLINAVHREAVRFEPALDGLAILQGKAEALAELREVSQWWNSGES